jgi:hypothetical protein
MTSRSATADVHATRHSRLRKKHGAKLAGSNHADRHRPSGGLTLEQHGVEVHGILDRRSQRSEHAHRLTGVGRTCLGNLDIERAIDARRKAAASITGTSRA